MKDFYFAAPDNDAHPKWFRVLHQLGQVTAIEVDFVPSLTAANTMASGLNIKRPANALAQEV